MVRSHFNVIWDKRAQASLRGIYIYIKKRDSERQAIKVRDAIKDLARGLGHMPHKYAKDPLSENGKDEIHFKLIWNYRIIYEIGINSIIILDIIHTSRNPENIKLRS